ncbi:MAG: extracellular solute-binding protein [Mesorhizobium sp.]
MIASLSRRHFLGLGAAAAVAPILSNIAFADSPADIPLHGLSAFGELKYGPDFTHFDYASPDAPKGGTFNFSPPNWYYNQNPDTFNTLNTFVPNGDAPPRMELCFDSLMTRALDEPDAIYGLLAQTVTILPDRRTYEFRLRDGIRFHDGSPLTAEDVAFTYGLFKEKGHAHLRLPLNRLESATAIDAKTVRLVFAGEHSARAVLSAAVMPIVSKAYFETRPFDSSQLTPPLGSGPYKVGRFVAGQFIEYERAPDYWGKEHPARRGLGHFDRIRIEFYRDRQASFEAFKKGNVSYRQEFTSRIWATGYDFPAIKEGRVVRRTFPRELRPSMQAWALNTRRKQFEDVRVRQAIGMCFDFEWTNRNLFYEAYARSDSLFQNSEFMAQGWPSPEELELLEPLRDKVPAEVFGEAVKQPRSDGSGRDRALLRRASDLLAQAGYSRPEAPGFLTRVLAYVGLAATPPDPRFVINRNGERIMLEMLVDDDVFVRIDQPFVDSLRSIGIDASIRMVDDAQFTVRQSSYDFDVLSMAASLSATPTYDDLEAMFHSSTADVNGARNLPGTHDEAVDALLGHVDAADKRDELIIAVRALDRVLRARHDWIPNWHSTNHLAAYWDMYGFKEPKPDYGFPVETLWWFDTEKAKKIGKA